MVSFDRDALNIVVVEIELRFDEYRCMLVHYVYLTSTSFCSSLPKIVFLHTNPNPFKFVHRI